MKKCVACKGKQIKNSTINYRWDTCGLPRVTIKNTKVYRCATCGEEVVEIAALDKALKALAELVARKTGRLAPKEIRFLRKHLDWSGADFAREFQVDPATISKWENGKQDMGVIAEKLLRYTTLMAMHAKDRNVPHIEPLKQRRQRRIEMTKSRSNWVGSYA